MRAGPEIDAEIARKVFKAFVVFDRDTEKHWFVMASGNPEEAVPPYSAALSSADLVITFLREHGWTFQFRKDDSGYLAGFSKDDGSVYRQFHAEELPLAICIAALAVSNGTHIQNR